MYNEQIKTIELPDGRKITLETGKLAKQAHGSVVIRLEDTMLLATVVSNYEAKDGIDFLPLTVDYREKFASAGRFPGGFFKREARPSELEILTMRLVDRALRPLFPNDYHNELQVMIQLMSSDQRNMPDALACLAASAAIALSDIPFNGPVSEVRVARVDGKWIINPTFEQVEEADIEMMVAGTEENIVMVEGEMQEVSEEEMVEAIREAHKAIKIQCRVQIELAEAVGKKTIREYAPEESDEGLKKEIYDYAYKQYYDIAMQASAKEERSEKAAAVKAGYLEKQSDEVLAEKKGMISKYFSKTYKEAVRNVVLDEGIRLDGRKLDEVRPIWTEIGYLPGTHGSAIFTRGETQSLTTLTLGNKMDQQTVDTALAKGSSSFMLHYNFPPFCTGEARPLRGTSRREIGHGNLAYRALKGVLPKPPENPYTIRLVSEVLESNGSSSMATVCAGTLALMDGGVNISKPVSGIAMGMISREDGKYAILSDILGDEDHLGDMDFKVTGTEDGITACQMDIKVDGLSYEVLAEALAQAKKGRLHILGKMNETISAPNPGLKSNAPQNHVILIPRDLIGAVIGPGGKIVQEIQKESGATVIIEEVENGGKVTVFSPNQDAMDIAVNKIKEIVAMPEEGEEYDGVVKSVVPFGAFIEFMPGKEGLLHISEIKWERIEKMDGVLEVGEDIRIKLIGVDPKSGKFRLSRKVLLPKPQKD